jgi:hypothetical protein
LETFQGQDISKFFDHVNHDILMGRIGTAIRDKRVLGLIGKYLRRGAMVEGVVITSEEGTPDHRRRSMVRLVQDKVGSYSALVVRKQVPRLSTEPPTADRNSAGEHRTIQSESAKVVAKLPEQNQQAIAGHMAELHPRLVGILPTGRGQAADLPAGRLDTSAHPKAFLAAVA